ncbi:LytTR family two component transcriptional regulator [Gillisia sp. Hel_I_86]|uniref:LytR/AlgR family response regulator transcription factor n=1 Tax=Gillisia sp. Hel_I_86 TaxID=1249981 RepID=UPI00119C3A30|nr:LytTR family DNA-binding domain-containing protein [Gillisia sp. Hel_I_86]TVZ27836.1 LytTR family two component transcriptional regulator [Gillisia sp. Hel_I_86]
MKCIIIDDEQMARVIIEDMILNTPELSLAGSFANAIEAMKFLNQNEVDLVFLDIHMPAFTGFDFIQTIKNPPKIILITSDKDFALTAFEYDFIMDYLVKPLSVERFNKAVQRTLSFNNMVLSNKIEPFEDETNKILYVNIDRRLIKIDIPSINIIEAKGDYILIKTEKKNYTVHSTLKKIEDKLPESIFLKVHRSYVINFLKIIDIEDNSVLIEKNVIPISRSNRAELMKRLNLL